MGTEDRLAHISATQLAMYCRCGEQYRRRYLEGTVIPPGRFMIRGKAVHLARKFNLGQKITSGHDLPQEQVVECARDEVKTGFAGEVLIEPGQSIKTVRGEVTDEAVRLAVCDYECFQKPMVPILVEREARATVPGLGRDILGYIDTVDDGKVIRDLKTAKRTPNQDQADKSDQLTTYALLYRAEFGELPAAVQLDAIVDLKAGPKAVEIVSDRTADDLDVLLRRYYSVIQAIDKGVFVPAPADFWGCAQEWCGYYGTCVYVRRGSGRPAN